MKTLKCFSILALLFTTIPSFAQEMVPEKSSPSIQLENQLLELTTSIELYFDDMISLKSALALHGLKETSQQSKMSPDFVQTLADLEKRKIEIIDALVENRVQIEEFSRTADLRSQDKMKFLYDIAVIKAFLPRYNVAKVSILKKIFSSFQPQHADELITRNDALELFFKEFETNESSKDALNSAFRISELVKVHNTITTNINDLRNSQLHQVYPRHLRPETGLQEAELYTAMIRGEDMWEVKSHAEAAVAVKKLESDNTPATPSCGRLFKH